MHTETSCIREHAHAYVVIPEGNLHAALILGRGGGGGNLLVPQGVAFYINNLSEKGECLGKGVTIGPSEQISTLFVQMI